jgi:transcription antitermination factor NusG
LKARRSKNGSLAFFIAGREGKIQTNGTEEAKLCLNCIVENLKPMSKQKHWYALYTKPRWEKKVHELLLQKGLQSYCPLNKVRKKWSDRYKMVEEPLFKSYVFVRVTDEERADVRFVDGVVNYVYWLGKPAQVKEIEIERIKRFLNEFEDVEVEQLPEPKQGDKVVITSGVFMDQEGRILSADKKRVEVLIESLGFKLVATLDKEKVAVK